MIWNLIYLLACATAKGCTSASLVDEVDWPVAVFLLSNSLFVKFSYSSTGFEAVSGAFGGVVDEFKRLVTFSAILRSLQFVKISL